MTISGLFEKISRDLQRALNRLFKRDKKISRKWKEERARDRRMESRPRSTKSIPEPRISLDDGKIHIPFLRQGKRLLAAILLLINFVMSQFIAFSSGAGGVPLFIFFLMNSFILLDYIWKTRRSE